MTKIFWLMQGNGCGQPANQFCCSYSTWWVCVCVRECVWERKRETKICNAVCCRMYRVIQPFRFDSRLSAQRCVFPALIHVHTRNETELCECVCAVSVNDWRRQYVAAGGMCVCMRVCLNVSPYLWEYRKWCFQTWPHHGVYSYTADCYNSTTSQSLRRART